MTNEQFEILRMKLVHMNMYYEILRQIAAGQRDPSEEKKWFVELKTTARDIVNYMNRIEKGKA